MPIKEVSLVAFLDLAPSAQREDTFRLWEDPEHRHLVLFTDGANKEVAVLPVGPSQMFQQVEQVEGKEIEGMRPTVAVRCKYSDPAEPVQWAKAWEQLRQRERELEELREHLRHRETYIAECENRLSEVAQSLTERETILDHREQSLATKEREFFRRVGENPELLQQSQNAAADRRRKAN